MKKVVCCLLAAAIALPLLGLTACSRRKELRGETSYTICAEYDPALQKLTAKMQVSAVNTSSSPLEALRFSLPANAYREGAKYRPVSENFSRTAYYGGASYGGIEITGVEGAERFSVEGEDANILALSLSAPLAPGKRTEIAISYEVELARVNHRLGVGEHAVNLANFYPILCFLDENGYREYAYSSCGDPFVSDLADYDVTLTVPETYTVCSGFAAEPVEGAEAGKQTFRIAAKGVREIAFVLGEGFVCETAEQGGVEIAYYYLPQAAKTSSEKALTLAAESLGYFSESFLPYAYPRYAVVSTDFVYGGMEYPALSMISLSLTESELAAVIAHETAHQWWYAMVGSDQVQNAWQDEGLAEYSAALFLEAHPEYSMTYRDFITASERSYRAYFSVYSQLHEGADTRMVRPLDSYTGEYEYRNIAYDKGVILFDRLREIMGKEKFCAALCRYAEKFSGKMATPADLVSCFSYAGNNVSALFDSFLEGKCVI